MDDKKEEDIAKAKIVYYTVHRKLPVKGDSLTLADSMDYKKISEEISEWALQSGFNKKSI